MAKLNLTPNVNPALLTEILDHEGYVAFWYRDGGMCRVVTDAPYAAFMGALAFAGVVA